MSTCYMYTGYSQIYCYDFFKRRIENNLRRDLSIIKRDEGWLENDLDPGKEQ